MTVTVPLLTWQEGPKDRGPIAPYVADFSIDPNYIFHLSGLYGESAVKANHVVCDNLANNQLIQATFAGNVGIKLVSFQRSTLYSPLNANSLMMTYLAGTAGPVNLLFSQLNLGISDLVNYSNLQQGGGGGSVTKFFNQSAAYTPITAVIPFDDTPPLIGEGAQLIAVPAVVYTAAQTVSGKFSAEVFTTLNQIPIAAIFRDNTLVQVGLAVSAPVGFGAARFYSHFDVDFVDQPGAPGTSIYTVRVGVDATALGTIYFNGDDAGRKWGGGAKIILDIDVT